MNFFCINPLPRQRLHRRRHYTCNSTCSFKAFIFVSIFACSDASCNTLLNSLSFEIISSTSCWCSALEIFCGFGAIEFSISSLNCKKVENFFGRSLVHGTYFDIISISSISAKSRSLVLICWDMLFVYEILVDRFLLYGILSSIRGVHKWVEPWTDCVLSPFFIFFLSIIFNISLTVFWKR